VIDERDFLLNLLVPGLRVCFERLVEARVGPKRCQERGLIIRAPPDPAIGNSCPFGDGVTGRHHLLDVSRRAVELVGKAAAASVGFHRQRCLARGIVQGVVEACNHPNRVSECRMRRDVLYALAVDPDLAAVPQAFEVLGSSERTGPGRSARGIGWRGASEGHRFLRRAFYLFRGSSESGSRFRLGIRSFRPGIASVVMGSGP
jgi:hypothetical protein